MANTGRPNSGGSQFYKTDKNPFDRLARVSEGVVCCKTAATAGSRDAPNQQVGPKLPSLTSPALQKLCEVARSGLDARSGQARHGLGAGRGFAHTCTAQ
jgi:cyclophilin family peptidyl-prolyl cis-trans isomerase